MIIDTDTSPYITNLNRNTSKIEKFCPPRVVRGWWQVRAETIGQAESEWARTSGVVGSSPRQERLASVSFGRNTDRLSKRHEATAKTNLKCLLTKQSELAALPAHEETGAFAVYSSLWLLSSTALSLVYSCPIPLFSNVHAPKGAATSPSGGLCTQAPMFSRSFEHPVHPPLFLF